MRFSTALHGPAFATINNLPAWRLIGKAHKDAHDDQWAFCARGRQPLGQAQLETILDRTPADHFDMVHAPNANHVQLHQHLIFENHNTVTEDEKRLLWETAVMYDADSETIRYAGGTGIGLLISFCTVEGAFDPNQFFPQMMQRWENATGNALHDEVADFVYHVFLDMLDDFIRPDQY